MVILQVSLRVFCEGTPAGGEGLVPLLGNVCLAAQGTTQGRDTLVLDRSWSSTIL